MERRNKSTNGSSLAMAPQPLAKIYVAPGIDASCEDPRLEYLNPKSESAVAWKRKVQQQIVHGSCHLHVLLLARQRNSIFICTLLLNLPFPFMRIKNTIINVQVSAGEELTWCYTNVLQPQAATVAKHLDTWMFKCSCPRWWNYHDNMLILEVKA